MPGFDGSLSSLDAGSVEVDPGQIPRCPAPSRPEQDWGRFRPWRGLPATGPWARLRWLVTFPARMVVGLLLLLIGGYRRFVSPWLPPACRFHPTCSDYTAQCLIKYGLLSGLVRGGYRLLRCQPLCKGGYDPP